MMQQTAATMTFKERQAIPNEGSLGDEYRRKVQDRVRAEQGDKASLSFPDHIMQAAAGRFAYTMSASMEAPSHFFFLSYLACLGSYFADRITLKTELNPQPRLYLVLLGQSADDRKSTAITKTVSFFQQTLSDFSACFGVGSAEGLQKLFQKNSKILLVYDELKAFVSKAKVEGSVLLPCVCTLYESNRYESHTRDRGIVLNGAHLSLLGASTIETYERTWDSAFTDIGMTNRLFIVPGEGKRRFPIPVRIGLSDWISLKNDLRAVLDLAEVVTEIDVTPEALAIYTEWYLNLEQSIHSKRLDTYALRFMILLSLNAGKTQADERIVRDVIDLLNWELKVRKLHDPIGADNLAAQTELKIRRALEPGPLTERDLKKNIHYERTGIWIVERSIENLSRTGEIFRDKKDKKWHLK